MSSCIHVCCQPVSNSQPVAYRKDCRKVVKLRYENSNNRKVTRLVAKVRKANTVVQFAVQLLPVASH